jgi:hypothetical protein
LPSFGPALTFLEPTSSATKQTMALTGLSGGFFAALLAATIAVKILTGLSRVRF